MTIVFISYRRQDSKPIARLIYDPLVEKFGRDEVFMDTQGISLGIDFHNYLNAEIASTELVLAVIADRWLTAADARGRRRADDPDDFVRIELEAALARGIPIVPLYVDGTRPLQEADLPDSLKPIARRQAAFLDTGRTFETDMARLIVDLEGLLDRQREGMLTDDDGDADRRLVRTMRGHSKDVWSVAVSNDGSLVMSGGADRRLRLWETATGREVRTFDGHESTVTAITFSVDGKLALSADSSGALLLWNVASGEQVRRFKGNSAAIFSVALSLDGQLALSGGADHTVKLWQAATGDTLHAFNGPTGAVYAVAFSPDGRFAFSGGRDNVLRMWEIGTRRELRQFTGHFGSVTCIGVSGDDGSILSGSWDKTLKLWEAATGREVRTLSGHSRAVYSLGWSANYRFAYSVSWDARFITWDVATGRQRRAFAHPLGLDLSQRAAQLVRDAESRAARERILVHAEDTLLDALVGEYASSPTQDTFRKKLRSGDLDDREVEVQLDHPPGYGIQILFPSVVYGRGSWRGTVRDARYVLAEQAADRLLDHDLIKREAITLVESNGIPLHSTAFTADGRFVLCGSHNTVKMLQLG